LLTILEGLNGAGKTSVINRYIVQGMARRVPIPLPDFSNNIRWNDFDSITGRFKAKAIKSSKQLVSVYNFGVYETVLQYSKEYFETCGNIGWQKPTLLLDRSFITAYVYNSIDKETFIALSEYYKSVLSEDLVIVFLDTDVEKCIKRRENSKDKSYAVLEANKQQAIRDRFVEVLNESGLPFVMSKEGELYNDNQ